MEENNILLNKSNELAHLVYKITKNFPKEEVYGLTSQIRRDALSVPANITEGFARYSTKSNQQFLLISFGSLQELKYFIKFSFEEGIINEKDFNLFQSLSEECSKMLWKSIQTLKAKCDS